MGNGKRHRTWMVALAAGALLMASPPVRAQGADIITELSTARAEQVLKDLKLDFNLVNPGTYRFNVAGYKVLFFNKGNNVQLYASFKKTVTLTLINDWNRAKRYTRAYLDKDGDACLESDLDLEGGVSQGAIAELFKTWTTSLALFVAHIDFKGE